MVVRGNQGGPRTVAQPRRPASLPSTRGFRSGPPGANHSRTGVCEFLPRCYGSARPLCWPPSAPRWPAWACGLLDLAARSVPEADRIVAGLEATSAREIRLVESFTTSKTFTVMHDGQTRAEVVAALQFTAPDVKAFAILESRGSEFIRDRVINKMMQTEVELAQRCRRSRVAISPDNYAFGDLAGRWRRPRDRDSAPPPG